MLGEGAATLPRLLPAVLEVEIALLVGRELAARLGAGSPSPRGLG